jgi:hypothetical protein
MNMEKLSHFWAIERRLIDDSDKENLKDAEVGVEVPKSTCSLMCTPPSSPPSKSSSLTSVMLS